MRLFSNASIAASLALALCACSDDGSTNDPDASPGSDASVDDPDAPYQSCGDGLITGTEECDDGNEEDGDECNADCTAACGDGVVNESEKCDTGIAAGEPGACPTECAAPDACTIATLSGDNCKTECLTAPITEYFPDDGCCPDGGNENLDSDCDAVCGNGAVETDEVCDPAIEAGSPGACPQEADCADALACTDDVLVGAGTCVANCQNPEITMPADGDGCCPDGATIATDSDCAGECGDGVVTPPELCDKSIPAGSEGACPTAADCVDADACTTDALVGGGTCNAACTHTPITGTGIADGCCPPLGNANNDADCDPECGNSVVEAGETCDDGGTAPGDGCDAACALEPVAFRISTLELRDPHAFANIIIFCSDITGQLNEQLATAVTTDDDGDGLLELNGVNVFRPLDRTKASTPLELHFTDNCTAPIETTECTTDPAGTVIMSTANNQSAGTCLAPVPGTTGGYSPAVTNATAPCYVSDSETLDLSIGDLVITLTDARIAGTYTGTAPDRRIINGLVSGFISEEAANATILPADLPLVGGQPLSSLLRGGEGVCQSGDDRDTGPGGVTGWYFYLNFTADEVPWSD